MDDRETIDMYLYRHSEYKAKQIGEIETILIQNAIDKYLFKNANYLSKKDVATMTIEPAYRHQTGSRTFKYQPNDKKYSRVCSFTNVCNYMSEDNIPKLITNEDTFQIQYSQGLIDVYKKRIHNLFIHCVSYTLDELIDGLSEYKEVYEDLLFHAIREMETEKYTLHNIFGNKGYLTITDGLYNFQPYFNEDKLISPYYRLNRGISKKFNYIIESKNKRRSQVIKEKQQFDEESINRVHSLLINHSFEEYEIKILQFINLDNHIQYDYLFDRLSFQDKLIIGYSVMLYLKDNEIYNDQSFMNSLVNIIQSLFIYYDTNSDTYIYYDKYDSKLKDKLIGFFLYHNSNKKPVFYRYSSRIIEVFNRVDEIDIVQMIKLNKNHKSLSIKGPWGFMVYSERHKYKDNGIVLKIIKSTDKLRKNYVFPPGPGSVIISQSSAAWIGESTLKFILEELIDCINILSSEQKEEFISSKSKKKYVFFIELCLRMKSKLLKNDLIFMKYY